ncbi:MAG: proline--tRNA ligase [Parcubacteria group bacterium]|nr:proline--tRNA ligase [Parcubacteria group bacterium]
MNEQKITPRSEDYSKWYLDVVEAASLAENAPVRGCMIIKPYGYALWEQIQAYLDARFKESGVQNAYFPLFIPEKFLKREESHVEGFAPEVAVVTHAGGKKLEEPLVVRPTSETIMYDTFSRWVQSYRDLPLLINQWANVVRWEMRPRLFLRTTEFLWQEGHTVHETEKDADDRARQMLEVYRVFAEEIMAVPVTPGMKSESERFAGALRTYTIEAMMQDGKALQFGTSHNLGQNFAKAFDVMFLDRNQEKQFAWQTSWGVSTRTIGGLIMTHSDDKGLVLPPKIAPIQAVITTIGQGAEREAVEKKALELAAALKAAGIRSHIDSRDLRPGEKYFEWEKKGVPVRIELGPKDVAKGVGILVRRDTGEKSTAALGELADMVHQLLASIQTGLYNRALEYRQAKTKTVDTWDDFTAAIESGHFVLAHWCGDSAVEKQIKEETGATIRCIPFAQPEEKGVCVKSGQPSTKRVIFAKAY